MLLEHSKEAPQYIVLIKVHLVAETHQRVGFHGFPVAKDRAISFQCNTIHKPLFNADRRDLHPKFTCRTIAAKRQVSGELPRGEPDGASTVIREISGLGGVIQYLQHQG